MVSSAALKYWPRANNRTHRELIVIDGQIGFIGGAGVADHGGMASRSKLPGATPCSRSSETRSAFYKARSLRTGWNPPEKSLPAKNISSLRKILTALFPWSWTAALRRRVNPRTHPLPDVGSTPAPPKRA